MSTPGGTRRGSVVVEVPVTAKGLRFRVKGNLTAAGAVWQLT